MNRTETYQPPRRNGAETLRGGRSTEALDLEDATEAYQRFLPITGDSTAAAIMAGAVLISESIREGRS